VCVVIGIPFKCAVFSNVSIVQLKNHHCLFDRDILDELLIRYFAFVGYYQEKVSKKGQ
jgi:hypothetical protein